jgi:hypothetical protein
VNSSFLALARRRITRYVDLGFVLFLVFAMALDARLGSSVSTTVAHHAPVAAGIAWGHG